MNKLSRLIALAGVVAFASNAVAASKSKGKTSSAKTTAAKRAVRSAKPATPPSKATRPTGYYDTLAHQKAILLVKQAADTYAKGDYNKAIWLCKSASDAYPTYARAQTWMGASYHKLGRYDEARSAYKWAMALAPGTVDAERAERGLREIGD